MPPSKDTAYDEPRNSRLVELLKAVKVANETKEASSSSRSGDTTPCASTSGTLPQSRDTLHETSDSPRLVAHDQELVQCRHKPPTSLLIHLLKAVEVVHEVKDAAPGLHNTLHETSDSHLVAHDDLLVWRKPHTGLLIQLLNPVEIAPGRRGTRHGTSRFVASGHTILNSELPARNHSEVPGGGSEVPEGANYELPDGAESGGDSAGLSAHPLSMQTEEGAERKETVEDGTEAKAEEGTESKSDGDEGAPVFMEKKRPHDLPSYCGWRYEPSSEPFHIYAVGLVGDYSA